MFLAYRIFQTVHAAKWNDGEGAFRYGGRWNSPGTRVLYTSASLSLAALEVLVYLDDEKVLAEYSHATVGFDEKWVKNVEDLAILPANWREFPIPDTVRKIGNDWIRQADSAILRVPTAILPAEFNYVVNLEHPLAREIVYGSVTPFVFDARFSKRTNKR
ncbi:MAG: RES domain-containing protein [Acidobacteriota bacterium]